MRTRQGIALKLDRLDSKCERHMSPERQGFFMCLLSLLDGLSEMKLPVDHFHALCEKPSGPRIHETAPIYTNIGYFLFTLMNYGNTEASQYIGRNVSSEGCARFLNVEVQGLLLLASIVSLT